MKKISQKDQDLIATLAYRIHNDNRFEKVFNLILYFNKIPIEELHDLYVKMIPTLKYNYKLLLSYGTTVNLSGSLKRSILDVIE